DALRTDHLLQRPSRRAQSSRLSNASGGRWAARSVINATARLAANLLPSLRPCLAERIPRLRPGLVEWVWLFRLRRLGERVRLFRLRRLVERVRRLGPTFRLRLRHRQ